MMQNIDIASLENFSIAVKGETKEIISVYCADLLSWAMGRAPEGCAWCTIMGNINAVAVASLADASAIILCENAVLDDDAAAKAKQQNITILRTSLPAFEAGLSIARAAKLYHL